MICFPFYLVIDWVWGRLECMTFACRVPDGSNRVGARLTLPWLHELRSVVENTGFYEKVV